MSFHFAYPAVLGALLLAAAWFWLSLRRKRAALTHSQAGILAGLAGPGGALLSRIPLILRLICLVLLILAAARPQFYNVSREIKTPGVDIMLCLDTSGSMQALDFELDGEPVDRLTAVKKVVSEFIQKRENDRVGLVVFGSEAFTQSPLTLDKGLLLSLVKRLKIGMARDQTAIGSALAIGGKRLKDLKAKSKILILLTDGRHNAGQLTPDQAAEAVAALGVKIYTIGVGGREPAPFPVRTPFGMRIVRQRVSLDEDNLRRVADIGHGKYYWAGNTEELAQIYRIIDMQEKTEAKVKEFFHFEELYAWFLIPAILLLMLELIIRATVLRILP